MHQSSAAVLNAGVMSAIRKDQMLQVSPVAVKGAFFYTRLLAIVGARAMIYPPAAIGGIETGFPVEDHCDPQPARSYLY